MQGQPECKATGQLAQNTLAQAAERATTKQGVPPGPCRSSRCSNAANNQALHAVNYVRKMKEIGCSIYR